MYNKSKCLLKSRAKGYWVTTRVRYMTVSEMPRLHGIDPAEISCIRKVTDREVGVMSSIVLSQNVL